MYPLDASEQDAKLQRDKHSDKNLNEFFILKFYPLICAFNYKTKTDNRMKFGYLAIKYMKAIRPTNRYPIPKKKK